MLKLKLQSDLATLFLKGDTVNSSKWNLAYMHGLTFTFTYWIWT